MSGAGALRGRVHCQSREAVDDGLGSSVTGPWTTRFTVAAGFTPLRGGEQVMAARLSGTQPYVVRVRQSSQTRQVMTGWRLVDARNPARVLAITAINDPDSNGAWLDIIVTEGAAS